MKFKWTDELVMAFGKVVTNGSYGDYNGLKTIQDKLERFKTINTLPNKPPKVKMVNGKHTYVSADNMIWYIEKHVLNNGRKKYKFWTGESSDGKHEIKEDSLGKVKDRIKIKFG